MLKVFIHLVPEAEGFALSIEQMWAARPEQPRGTLRRGSFSPSHHKSPSSSAAGRDRSQCRGAASDSPRGWRSVSSPSSLTTEGLLKCGASERMKQSPSSSAFHCSGRREAQTLCSWSLASPSSGAALLLFVFPSVFANTKDNDY